MDTSTEYNTTCTTVLASRQGRAHARVGGPMVRGIRYPIVQAIPGLACRTSPTHHDATTVPRRPRSRHPRRIQTEKPAEWRGLFTSPASPTRPHPRRVYSSALTLSSSLQRSTPPYPQTVPLHLSTRPKAATDGCPRETSHLDQRESHQQRNSTRALCQHPYVGGVRTSRLAVPRLQLRWYDMAESCHRIREPSIGVKAA